MKGVIPIISIILILIIVTILASLMWTWIFGLTTDITEEGETSISHLSERLSSCILLDSINHNTIYIRNCGQGVITNDTLNIFIDGKEFNFSMTPESIEQGELATITMPIWGMSIGDHTLKIVNPKTETTARFEAELPDSAVLALDFEEGSGTIAYDSSKYGNDGTIYGATWIDGKFGRALDLDGISSDYVEIPDSPSLDFNRITVSAWVRFAKLGDFGMIANKKFAWRMIKMDSGNGNRVRTDIYISSTNYQKNSDTVNLLNDNNWHHVALTFDGSRTMIYIDGTPDGTLSISGNIDTNTEKVIIGKELPNAYHMNATIDSVRIYNEALTPDETVILKIK